MKTTYDYSPLDAFFESLGWTTPPKELDNVFRSVHGDFTRALVALHYHDIAERPEIESVDIHILDRFFRAVGELAPVEKTLMDLSPGEIEDVKRWRDINRVRDLLGDVKQMEQHRRNLKEAFAGTEDPEARKTWEALDASLGADIRFAESLTADVTE